MNEVLLLIGENGARQEVFGKPISIGTTEFYQAAATNQKPELKFILADYLDYSGEPYVQYEGTLYRIMRTYRTGQEIELTLTLASAEEVELYGE